MFHRPVASSGQSSLLVLTADPDPLDEREADPRCRYSGLYDQYGVPKLLARLLESGVGEVAQAVADAELAAPKVVGTRPLLVTGGAGFIGANLADRLAAEGEHVRIYDSLARPGVERNLRWLVARHPGRISTTIADLRDDAALADAASDASGVFHLASQVAVTSSLLRPVHDFDINVRATVALLDILRRRNPDAPLLFASTNKVYGDLADIELVCDRDRWVPRDGMLRARGVDESRALSFHTPYGCSKGAADQYVLDYARSYGLKTAVLRMSCIYGEHQLGTEDQGWLAHFALQALARRPLSIFGDGCQVRDVLHVGDAVGAYCAAWRKYRPHRRPGVQSRRRTRQCHQPAPAHRTSGSAAGLPDRARVFRLAGRRPTLFRRRRAGHSRHPRAARAAGLARGRGPARRPFGQPLQYRSMFDGARDRGRVVRVALVNPRWHFENSIYFGCQAPHLPLELGCCKVLLEQAGHEVRMLDGHLDGLGTAELSNRVADFAPGMTVITTAPSYLFWRCAPPELRVPREMVTALGGRGGCVVAVGPHGSSTPDATLRKMGADIVIRGECEEAVAALARAWPAIDVPGVSYRHRGVLQNVGPVQATGFSDLPPLHWSDAWITRHTHHHHRFDTEPHGPGAEVEASRGCPYHCSFCAKIDFRDRYRRRDLPNLLVEIDALAEQGVRLPVFHRRNLSAPTSIAGSACGAEPEIRDADTDRSVETRHAGVVRARGLRVDRGGNGEPLAERAGSARQELPDGYR